MKKHASIFTMALFAAAATTDADWQIIDAQRGVSAWTAIYADQNLSVLIDEASEQFTFTGGSGLWDQGAFTQLDQQQGALNFAGASQESHLSSTQIGGSFYGSGMALALDLGDPAVLSAVDVGQASMIVHFELTEPTHVRILGGIGGSRTGLRYLLTSPQLLLTSANGYSYQRVAPDNDDLYFDDCELLAPGWHTLEVSIHSDPMAVYPDSQISENGSWLSFSMTVVPAPTSAAVMLLPLVARGERRRL